MKIKIDQADRYFSLYVREKNNWTCERCHRKYERGSTGLQNSHFWGRGKESTRFSEKNCSALCVGCHMHFTANPQEHRDWMLKKLGAREYAILDLDAHLIRKKDRKLAKMVWKKAYEDLCKSKK